MLKDKVVAISGAAGRLGVAFAEAVLEQGGKVLLGDINTENLEKIIDRLPSSQVHAHLLDVRSKSSIQNFLAAGLQKFGKIDAFIHSAYPRSPGFGTPFGKLEESNLADDLMSQLGGSILVAQEAFEVFKKLGKGNLIFISSIQGLQAPKFSHYEGLNMSSPIEYSAIKSGIIAITRYLAKSVPGSNIRVNCISPGGILAEQPAEFIERYQADCLNKGMLDGKDVAGAAIFLLSELSLYINGQNIVVDDGWSL
jgi:NAD(P)-dependent dehydrogenase (short-subunit alcohol dehydrogenase family)